MFQWVTERPIAVSMLTLTAALFGVLAYLGRPLALMPPLSDPTLTIQTRYEGAAPEEVEEEVTRRIEERLSTLEGLIAIRSTSRADQSEVSLELRWGSPIDHVLQRAYERLERIRFPEGVEAPQILRLLRSVVECLWEQSLR